MLAPRAADGTTMVLPAKHLEGVGNYQLTFHFKITGGRAKILAVVYSYSP